MGAMATSAEITRAPSTPTVAGNQLATVAAGCFWGLEKFFVEEFGKDAIKECAVGYTGGELDQPTYEQVCSGRLHKWVAL